MNMKSLILVPVFTLLAACGSTPTAPQPAPTPAPLAYPTSLDEALTSPFRSAENMKRDEFRHPKETLNFFGIQPNMTVIEVSPGMGWYSEILIPYLAPQGKFIAASPPVAMFAPAQKYLDFVASRPEYKDKVTVTDFAPPTATAIAPDESADMVLTFRNVHNWMKAGGEKEAFKAFFKALKPGGILGVVEHRESAKKKADPKAENGYVQEKQVIKLAEAAGFKLVNKSEINANAKDTKDYPQGVWTLPPTYKEGDKDKAKYAAIGESDRMTMKFVKPAGKAKSKKK